MKIAIIGSGNVGKALGSSLVRSGNEVVFAATSHDKAKAAAEAEGGKAATSAREAAAGAEVIVLAVPYVAAGKKVADEIAAVVKGKVVIDVTNPIGPGGTLVTADGPSGAENFAAWMPGASIVKAFNTLFNGIQRDPKAHGVELDALYATDDAKAGATVARLARGMGFRPIAVGPLARARELEGMAFLNIKLQIASGGSWKSVYALLGAPDAAVYKP
jgi:8-hydroxy-5-deazaflavin:NADPH oxidoreductase